MKPPDPKPLEGKHVMCVKKTALKNIVRCDPMISERIQDAVFRTHTVMVHTTHFLKLYLLHLYQSGQALPTIDEAFLAICMRTVSNLPPEENRRGRPPNAATKAMMEQLKTFYQAHYETLMGPNPGEQRCSLLRINDLLQYEETDLLKNLKNNVSMHFLDYCKEFVNKSFGLKERLKEVDQQEGMTEEEKKLTKRGISVEFRLVKEDLLAPLGKAYQCPEAYHQWLNEHKPKLITKERFMKDSLAYEVKAKSLDYLPSMIHVCHELEKMGRRVHAIPLRTSHVPSYITLDTTTLIMLMVDEGAIKLRQKVKEVKEEVWNAYFDLTNRAFRRKDYRFHGMIKTDGMGCSILFHRRDQSPERMNDDVEPAKELYVDEVENPPTDKNVVGIDPGKDDILHCTDGELFYRYTANQRRVQTKKKKYIQIVDDLKHDSYVDGLTVKEWESVLSLTNKYTCSFGEFQAYLGQKLPLFYTLREFYRAPLLRKLRWNTYINTQRSEDKMINVFRRTFGDPEHTVVAIGDWDQKGYHMPGKEPTNGKGLRKVLRRAGYDVFLVHEKNTSCTCHNCHSKTEKFLYRMNHKPKHYGEQTLVHGLLRCNSANGCGSLWNRDVNGSLNIRKLAITAFAKQERPFAFR